MSVAIVDYGSGNLHSAAKAFERAALESGAVFPIVVTSNADEVARAERIVLPGVGAFADCRHGLDNLDGMVDALNEAVLSRGRPFLGICVGMHLSRSRTFREQKRGIAAARLDVVPDHCRDIRAAKVLH